MEGAPHDPRVPMLQEVVSALQDQVQALKLEVGRLRAENAVLRRRVEELTPPPPPSSPPPFVKPAVAPGPRKKPGRPAGHEASLRPPPRRVDRAVEVPLPRDGAGRSGRCLCPRCRGPLSAVRRHRRLVEELVPARVEVVCYRTSSGYCRDCRRRVESRHPDQPPAGFRGDQPHAQLGLNALAAAAVLRVEHRLPFRQVCGVLAGLSGLRACAGAVARQLQRLARWLAGERERERIKLAVRAAPAVNADETGWRVGGRNGWLWVVGTPRHAVYHADAGRGGAVIAGLLGSAFGGTLGCDFYGGYDALPCRKQRCLAHLRRELRETARESPAFAAGAFYPKCRRLLRDMLALKRRWDELDDRPYARKAVRLEDRLLALARATWGEPHADRLAARLLRHEREVTAFLWRRDLEPTNNAAERDLRPAVVMRKVTGGSRSKAGADAWATVASVLRTARKQGRGAADTLKTLLVRHWAGEPPGLLAQP